MNNLQALQGILGNASLLEPQSIEDIDSQLIKDGKLIPIPTEEMNGFSKNERQLFCVKHGIYSLPTTELIEFIDSLIPENDKAIEIGSGNGVYARALGIKGTDNFMQHPKNRAKFKNCLAVYEVTGQIPVQYGEDVEEIDAIDAVKKYKPETIVGAWVTHKWRRTKPELKGNMFGIDFEWILKRDCIKRLIIIGNDTTHGLNPIMKQPHVTYELPFVFSRTSTPDLDRVYVWDM